MKKIITIILIAFTVPVFGQKVSAYRYNKVDTMFTYKNAHVLIYKNKYGKSISDTFNMNKMKMGLTIESVDYLEVDEDKVFGTKIRNK